MQNVFVHWFVIYLFIIIYLQQLRSFTTTFDVWRTALLGYLQDESVYKNLANELFLWPIQRFPVCESV
jgi:hypothetical protein